MRLFQNGGIHSSYLNRLNQIAVRESSFEGRRRQLIGDRFGALHLLKPVLDDNKNTFFTNGDDEILQRSWARERNMRNGSLLEILLAQIEEHRTEVFYNTDPTRYGPVLVKRLPTCVKKTICWRAAPSHDVDLSGYGVVVCNFPSILEDWRRKGCRVEYFFPAIDPVMGEYGHHERPIDILFVGGYTRHHKARVAVLESITSLSPKWNVVYCLDASRMTKIAESLPGRLVPQLRKFRRSKSIAQVARPAVFGRALYELIGQAKIVLNGAIDMAGDDRGNMRCFEAMGCGALLLSDRGNYPDGMVNGKTMVTYDNAEDAVNLGKKCLLNPEHVKFIATEGRRTASEVYCKTLQWRRFVKIVSMI
jgi:hypothetical protein